ncbi:MAG: hypothetical protein AAAB13_13865 [Pseudomonas sp.]
MSIHEWARREVAASRVRGEELGFDVVLALRALLSAVVEQNGASRSSEDLAHELQFLADNLDSERDYSFMRP